MNIQIEWKLKNGNQPVFVDVDVLENTQYLIQKKVLVYDNTTTDLNLCTSTANKVYQIILSRHEALAFDQTTHKPWVVINKIIIDDFWEFTESNFPSYTVYDNDYYNDAMKNRATWELEKDYFNNTLFFSGSIQLEITTPVRTMFWH